MKSLRQHATLWKVRSVVDSRSSAGEQCVRGYPIVRMLFLAWGYVARPHLTLVVLLGAEFAAQEVKWNVAPAAANPVK